jgi:predicted Na+-dependent transporter
MKELFADPLFLTAVGSFANSSFFCVVFAVASNIALRDLLQEVKKPALLLRAFGVISVIVPLLTAGVVKLLDVPLLVGGVILLGAVTAGSPLAFWGRRARGAASSWRRR